MCIRDSNTTEELIPEEANLLNIANFTSEIYADNLDDYYPRQNVVENIMACLLYTSLLWHILDLHLSQ